MDNNKLKEGLRLKNEIEKLEKFLRYMQDCSLKGEIAVKKPRFLFKYKSWRNKEEVFELNSRLTFRLLLEINKELIHTLL